MTKDEMRLLSDDELLAIAYPMRMWPDTSHRAPSMDQIRAVDLYQERQSMKARLVEAITGKIPF